MKNLKKTLKKFRKVRLSLSMKIISLLSCLALVSMGFASWWIIKVDTGTTMGSFTTYEVEEKNIHIDGFTSESDAEIVFGVPDVNNAKTGWLQVRSESKQENLEFTYTYDLWAENDDVRQFVDKVTLTFTPSEAVAANLNKAIARGYITAPTVSCKIGTGSATSATYNNANAVVELDIATNSAVVSVADKGDKVVQVSVTVTFAWGDAFKPSGENAGVNPYTYFNALASNAAPSNATYAKDYSNNENGVACETNAAFALAALTDLNNLLNPNNQAGAYTITYDPVLVQN